jgi:hypothetical protein
MAHSAEDRVAVVVASQDHTAVAVPNGASDAVRFYARTWQNHQSDQWWHVSAPEHSLHHSRYTMTACSPKGLQCCIHVRDR